jgi:hypothetical protein
MEEIERVTRGRRSGAERGDWSELHRASLLRLLQGLHQRMRPDGIVKDLRRLFGDLPFA